MKKKGVSVTLSTVMLTAIVLTIVLSIALFASGVIESQNQSMEFEEAKVNMNALAEIIEEVASKLGSSGYVRLNARAGGPHFVITQEWITVSIENGTYTWTPPCFPSQIRLIKYKGGSLVSVSDYVILRGNLSGKPVPAKSVPMLVPGEESIPLGWVYTVQENGAWIVVDFGRIRVIKVGTFVFSKKGGAGSETLGIVDIVYIHLEFGQLGGAGVFNVRARSVNITRYIERFNGSSHVDITAIRYRNGEQYTRTYRVSFSGVDGILVNVVYIKVVISTYG